MVCIFPSKWRKKDQISRKDSSFWRKFQGAGSAKGFAKVFAKVFAKGFAKVFDLTEKENKCHFDGKIEGCIGNVTKTVYLVNYIEVSNVIIQIKKILKGMQFCSMKYKSKWVSNISKDKNSYSANFYLALAFTNINESYLIFFFAIRCL